MHEINAAAETITAAADPDANIIFGATISPDLEGEIIITVVATGFEESYYANRSRVRSGAAEAKPVESGLAELASHDAEAEAELTKVAKGSDKEPEVEPASEVSDEDIKALDLEEDKKPEPSADFKDETPLPNIWNFENEPDEDTFDKPSFLRRLTRRKKEDTDDKDDEK